MISSARQPRRECCAHSHQRRRSWPWRCRPVGQAARNDIPAGMTTLKPPAAPIGRIAQLDPQGRIIGQRVVALVVK